jgi:putative oxidoreductase
MPNILLGTNAPQATILIRLLVGSVFLSEGIQKFLFPATLGVGRFVKIGIPAPHFFAPATIPLIVDISAAIVTTKIPIWSQAGFWSMAHEARTDYCMLLGLVFLVIVGSGPFSIDRRVKDS